MSVRSTIIETSRALVLQSLHSPSRLEPDGSGCLLPRLSQLAYEPIDSENGEIRLVELLPGQYDDGIQLNLHTRNLNDDIVYDALSYAWGTTNSSRRAIVNGCPVPVKESLGLGLRRLRVVDRSRILWIDALCINQGDTRERSHQVQQMAKIYKSANRVLIWLGEWPGCSTCPNSEDCQTMWAQVLSFILEEYIQQDYTIGSQKRLKSLCAASDHFIGHVMDICALPWFRRVWIIQEVVLPFADPLVFLGNQVFGFDAFGYAISNLEATFSHLWPKETLEEPEIVRTGGLGNRVAVLRRLRERQGEHRRCLYWCLVLSRDALATNPRDKVYGLLGICKFYVAEPILPDYSKSWLQVLAEATRAMILDRLLIPYLAFAFPLEEHAGKESYLPSWLLDLSRMRTGFAGFWENSFPGILTSEAIEHRRGLVRLSEDYQILYIHGKHIATIAAAYPNDDSHGPKQMSAVTLYDFYHTILKPKGVAPRCLYNTANMGFNCEQSLEEFTTSLLGNRHEFHPTFWEPAYEHALIITEEGSIGITWHPNSSRVRAGDTIVSLSGTQVPFILRPHQVGFVHQMINIAYIIGCSDGILDSYTAGCIDKSWSGISAESGPEYAII